MAVQDQHPCQRQLHTDTHFKHADLAAATDNFGTTLSEQVSSNGIGHQAADSDENHSCRPAQVLSFSAENYDRGRDDDEHSKMLHVAPNLVGRTGMSFLREHLSGVYAPMGKHNTVPQAQGRDGNSKFCYRHEPDSRCRRTVDVAKMEAIQQELDELPDSDRQAISHVWSLFSGAPAKQRALMLQGILTQCCYPQLSLVSREVQEQLKIDFIVALPQELSLQILGLLDSTSLCKAAQVSRRWSELADDDELWRRMCVQHTGKKCLSCGVGLPILEQRSRRSRMRHAFPFAESKLASSAKPGSATQPSSAATPATLRAPAEASLGRKRRTPEGAGVESAADLGSNNKRQRVAESTAEKCLVARPVEASEPLSSYQSRQAWKDIYRDRFKISYNWNYGPYSLKSFQGHNNGVTCLQLNHEVLVTGSYDTNIKVWDIESGELLRTLTGHLTGLRSLCLRNNRLVSACLSGVIRTWNWRTGECLCTMQAHDAGVLAVHFDGDYLASASLDHTVRVFKYSTKTVYQLRGHTDIVNHVRVDDAAKVIYSASDDCTVKLWDLKSLSCIRTFEGHVNQVQQILLMPRDFEPEPKINAGDDNVSTASGCSGTSRSGVLAAPADRAAFGGMFSDLVDPTRPLPARYMLTAGLDSTVRLWDIATGVCLNTFFGHFEGIWALDGDRLRVVTGANDSMVKVWDPRTGKCQRTFTGHAGPVACIGLSERQLASGGEDGYVRLYSFD